MLLLDAPLDVLLTAMAAGDRRANTLFGEYVMAEPRAGRLNHLSGLRLLQRGNRGEAGVRLDAAAREAPSSGAIRNNRGHVLMLRELWDPAAVEFRAAHELRPQAIEPLVNLADVLLACDLPSEARRVIDRAMRLDPQSIPAAIRLLRASIRVSDRAGAECAADVLAGVQEASAVVSLSLGRYFTYISDRTVARAHFERAAALGSGIAHSQLADLAFAEDRPADVARHAEAAIHLAPDYSGAWTAFATSRILLSRPEDASRAAQLALAFSRQSPRDLGQYTATMAFYLGSEVSLAGYEARWSVARDSVEQGVLRTHPPEAVRSRFSGRLWLGQRPGEHRDILIHSEQGLGDSLQYIRCVPLVQALGWRVHLATSPPLRRLFERIPGIASISTLEDAGAQPWHCPIASLPFAMASALDDPSAGGPYLSADEGTVEAWRRRLASCRGRKIGLAWACNPIHPRHGQRSVPWALLSRLAQVSGVTFVMLQVDDALGPLAFQRDPASWAGPAPLVDASAHGGDMLETAAVLEALDLVITVDSSILHLAGALGRPVWALLSAFPEAKWLPRQSRTWYPSVRIFQQPSLGDWVSVVDAVGAALSRSSQHLAL